MPIVHSDSYCRTQIAIAFIALKGLKCVILPFINPAFSPACTMFDNDVYCDVIHMFYHCNSVLLYLRLPKDRKLTEYRYYEYS